MFYYCSWCPFNQSSCLCNKYRSKMCGVVIGSLAGCKVGRGFIEYKKHYRNKACQCKYRLTWSVVGRNMHMIPGTRFRSKVRIQPCVLLGTSLEKSQLDRSNLRVCGQHLLLQSSFCIIYYLCQNLLSF